jgi:hypothetical protein
MCGFSLLPFDLCVLPFDLLFLFPTPAVSRPYFINRITPNDQGE